MEIVIYMLALLVVVVLALAAVRGLSNALAKLTRRENDDEETDPCMDCLRWPECNGVDAESCKPWQQKGGHDRVL